MRTRIFLPRPEYPRPDKQRGFVNGVDWINLNGAWEFRFDGERSGLKERWFDVPGERWPEQIIVPFCWESLAAWGEGDAAGNDNYYATRVYKDPLAITSDNYRGADRFEVGWYRRQITVPLNDFWKDKRVILTIGAADFLTDLWCNGTHLGRHEGGYDPIEYDLTDALKSNAAGASTGTVVVRVEDPINNTEQPVGKQWAWYSSASGIWQTVFLEPRAANHIRRFQVTTDIQKAEVRIRVLTLGDGDLFLNVISPTGQAFQARAVTKDGQADCLVELKKAILWDPNAPHLYALELRFASATEQDIVHSYFGIRSLAAQPVSDATSPAALTLNGSPIYVRGALYQSYYPDGIYTAGDSQTLRDDIAYAKRVGFDLLRVHIKVDDPLLLYHADTIGMLLMCDMPNFGEGGDTPVGRRRYEEMMRAAIERDFNHPSIVAWCLFNETWGFGGQSEFASIINPLMRRAGDDSNPRKSDEKLSNARSYNWIQEMWHLAKELDPTRLVEDMSVVAWSHVQYYGHGVTDINSWHFYINDYERAHAAIREVVAQTYSGSSFNYIPGFQQHSQPLICSEYGGIGALEGDVDTSWSFKFLTNELRLHPQLSAYIYTELHDVEWERNGFLNYDRTPKDFGYDPTIVNNGDVLPINAPPIRRCAPGEEIEVEVYSSHFSRKRREDVTLQWRFGGMDSLGWVHDGLAEGWDAIEFPHLRLAHAKTLRIAMPEQTMLCTLWVRAFVSDGTIIAANYVQFFVGATAPMTEQVGRRTIVRLAAESWSRSNWNGMSSSREQAAASGSAYGAGRGWFDWKFPVRSDLLQKARRITLLCEVSAFRQGSEQTDRFAQPSALRMLLNGVVVYKTVLPNHPHDARGSLSYLKNGRGAYGYLCHTTIEGSLLKAVLSDARPNHVQMRCASPPTDSPNGGLSVYGSESGRYPIGPTLIIE